MAVDKPVRPNLLTPRGFRTGYQLKNPVTGKIKLWITKITDGTLETTFTRHLYILCDRDGKPVIDPETGMGKKMQVFDFYPAPQQLKDLVDVSDSVAGCFMKYTRDVSDTEDVHVWYVKDPEVEMIDIQGEMHPRIITPAQKVQHDEFLQIHLAAEEEIRVELEQLEIEKSTKEQRIAGMAVTNIMNQVNKGLADAAAATEPENPNPVAPPETLNEQIVKAINEGKTKDEVCAMFEISINSLNGKLAYFKGKNLIPQEYGKD